MARHSSVLFLAISALLPACSRPATCALEGCAKNDSVVMANDLKPGNDADATAAKPDDWTQAIDDILVRMKATEALTALLNTTVELHETRLNEIEKRATDLETSTASANLRIAHSESEISALQTSLVNLEIDFDQKVADLSDDVGADIKLIWAEFITVRGELAASDKANQKEQDDLWKKVHSVESRLNTEVARLNIQDLLMFASTVQLRAKQQQTENDLRTLKSRVDGFIATQEGINSDVDKALKQLATDMTGLNKTLQDQISKSAGDVQGILDYLTPLVKAHIASIPELLTSVKNLQDGLAASDEDFETLEGRVDTLESAFHTDSDNLHELIANLNVGCTISAKYKVKVQGKDEWYQDLTCGSTMISIQVK